MQRQKILTFITVNVASKELQYNIVPRDLSFVRQNWILTFRDVTTKRVTTIPMAKITRWVEVPNEDINVVGRVY